MLSVLRRRVTYTNVVLTLALLFAMSGGAYAAKRYLITSAKQISPKVLKQIQGKAGLAGPVGPQGPSGPAGQGGPAGPGGAQGGTGASGANGVSVSSTESKAKIGPCKEGGSEFQAASGVTYACNGEKGKEGTFGGQTLPAGKTLKGEWAASTYAEAAPPANPGFGRAVGAVSFALPVSPALELSRAHYIGAEEGEGEAKENLPEEEVNGKMIKVCTGNHTAPAAAEGRLCVFGETEHNLLSSAKPSVAIPQVSGTTAGFTVSAFSGAKGAVWMEGTWAVTAE
jgi:hypothetical protein